LNRESLATQVRNVLREEIISGQLDGRARIDVKQYARKWAISTTPIRDAFKHLETEGLLRVSPRRGVYVAEVNWIELKEIYEVRMAIECTAVRLAAANIPPETAQSVLQDYRDAQSAKGRDRARLLREADFRIHEVAMVYCGNARLQRLAESIHDLVRWTRQTLIRSLPRPYEDTLTEHIAICEALCRGDGASAADAMYVHLANTLARISKFLLVDTAPRTERAS
jgi:DNA-binding GntR family transcriptional regulator